MKKMIFELLLAVPMFSAASASALPGFPAFVAFRLLSRLMGMSATRSLSGYAMSPAKLSLCTDAWPRRPGQVDLRDG